jgi:hypothetical protein
MTKSSALYSVVGPERTMGKERSRGVRHRSSARSKGLNKQISEFESAMASGKQETPSKKEQDSELYESDDFVNGGTNSDDPNYSPRKEDEFDPDCGYEGRWEPIDPDQLPDPMFRADIQAEPSVIKTTGEQPDIDLQRYQDIIEKITVEHTLPDDPKEVKIKFDDETLDGARVEISKNGDKIKIRWQTSSGSVYRMLTKQRFQLQQHVYGHLGIKSEVSVDFKKELKPRSAQQKVGSRSMRHKTPADLYFVD